MDWLLHALLSRLAWELILIGGGATGLAYVKAKAPTIAPYFLYGIAGATCIAILIFTFTGRPLNSNSPVEVTPENVEDNIKRWADNLGMSLERQNPTEEKFFFYIGRVHGGNAVEIFRAKEKLGYLQLAATINLSQQHRELLAKLPKPERNRLLNEVALEMSRQKMGGDLAVAIDAQQQQVVLTARLQKGVPIANLNEGYFADQFDEVARAVSQISAVINLELGTGPGP
jgi:hypothetical protein